MKYFAHIVHYIFGISLFIQSSTCIKVHEEVVCSRQYFQCDPSTSTIRVVDAIVGHIVGINECGTIPQSNCTASVTCEISEKSNKRLYQYFYPSSFSSKCSDETKYLIVKYMCGKWDYKLDGENFALYKPAFQSSLPVNKAYGGYASKAVDGNKNKKMSWTSELNSGSCLHTGQEISPWWRVDLEQRIAVSHVKIYNRDTLGARLCGFEIRIGDTTAKNGTESPRCGRLFHIPSNKDDVVACEPPLVGRYVTIVIPGSDKVLTLCEVEVYGKSVLGQSNQTEAKLVGSNIPYEGQVVLNGTTFCDPQWTPNDSNTTCIQLGYPKAGTVGSPESFFIKSDIVKNPLNKYFNCSGKEGSLFECSKQNEDGKSCTIKNTVTVRCQPFVRLAGSSVPLQGRVEVIHRGIWGTVCKFNRWTKADARVVCRELGFFDVESHTFLNFNRTTGIIWLRYVECDGSEASVAFCKHNNWEKNRCRHHSNDAGVSCSICAHPLLKNIARFPDSIFNASASYSPNNLSSSGRLYSPRPWCLPDNPRNTEQYLQITLPAIYSVSAVATVGGSLGYVTSYKLSYVVDGSKWSFATVNGKQTIPGNTNNDTHNVIRRELGQNYYVQKVRFIPQTMVGVPCMRVELCGKEIPRCQPPEITIQAVTSESAKIAWEPITIPETDMDHYNYSVTLRDHNGDNVLITTTTYTSIDIVRKLRPNHEYSFNVSGVGLECYKKLITHTFKTLEDVPNGPPKNFTFIQDSPTVLHLSWFPPDVEDQNGLITNYSVCFQTGIVTENCSKNGTIISTTTTSTKLKNLQKAETYYIWVRAYTEAGAGPYTKEKRIITGTDSLMKATNVNTTSSSFGLRLQTPRQGYSYIQIIVIKLRNKDEKRPSSFSLTKDQTSTENKSVAILQPYVTVELSVAQVEKYKDFTIGDGRNYERSSTTRRRRDNADKVTFYNRPLEAGLFYSAFQRTFKNEDVYYSSSWTEVIQTLRSPSNPSKASSNSSGVGVIIGVVAGLLVLIICVVLVVIIFLRRRKRKPKSDVDQTTHDNLALKQVPQDSYDDTYDNVAVRYDEYDTDSEDDFAETETEPDTIYGNSNVTNIRDTYRMVPVDEFQDYVQDMKKNDNYGFDQQYQELPKGVAFPCTIALKPENKPYNRYAKMISYDDVLVKLSAENGHNYINAGYIEGIAPKTYIATQGPTSKTIVTFWKMVWEQDSNLIIMLTNLKEGKKAKCSQYWPEKTKKYGDITVTSESTQLFPYYVQRTFLIAKGEETKYVTQFHFTAWPDHGLPKYPTQLLAFQHCIRSRGRINGPIICHCSAGVGRTGTFIAIDHSLEKLSVENSGSVDVFEILQKMRRCRVNMVQTLAQYVFIHDAILEYLLCGVNEIEGSSLEGTVKELEQRSERTKKTGFQEIFQRLQNFSPSLTNDECRTATLKANSKKNRTTSIYPADRARVTLSRNMSKNSSDYINATFVNGYKDINAYIATDHPLNNTFDDFWQMVYERHSPLIVMLNNFKEKNENYPKYFPVEKAKPIQYGDYFVRLEEQKEENATIFRKLCLSTSSDFKSSHTVRHYQYTQWPKGGVPSSSDDIINMINTIETAKRQNDQGPMVVHSGTGTGRAGTFLTLSICMERLKAEQRIDVFQCVKLIREKRPQFVENTGQFQFCYKVLARYVETFEGYSNFDPSEL